MDAKEIRSLQEAYLSVYSQVISESECEDEDEDESEEEMPKMNGKKKGKKEKEEEDEEEMKEGYDFFDAILEHLVAEGYADTNKAALAIMANMSEEWRGEIIDEAIRNPESRKKLRDIEDKEVRKGDKSKGENPRSKYPTEKGKLAGHLLRGPESTGSKGNPVRSRGGTNAPADERVGRGPHRAGNAAYWAGNAGPNRDRGAGNKASRRAGKSVTNTRDED